MHLIDTVSILVFLEITFDQDSYRMLEIKTETKNIKNTFCSNVKTL